MRFTISILTHWAIDEVKTCLDSVLNGGGDFELILTANGCPLAYAYFCEIKEAFPEIEIRVVNNKENLGFQQPNEVALTMARTGTLILLNDDAIVPHGWLGKIASEFIDDQQCAIVGPVGRRLRDDFVGGQPGEPIEYIEGSCMAIRVDLARDHGLFDPELKMAYGEDSDLCLRMRQLSYTIHQVDFEIKHKGGTTSRHVPGLKKYFDENHAYLRQKWAGYLKTRTFA